MRTLTYYVAVSLDGRIAAADGDYSAFPVEGDHLAALIERFPETFPGPARAALGIAGANQRFDTVVMGWNTYAVGLPFGLVDPYPQLRTVVVTRDPAARLAEALEAAPDGVARAGVDRIEFTSEDPVALVRALKADGGASDDGADGIWLCGGGRLARALLPEIDGLVLKTNPILLGGDGIPLFADSASASAAESAAASASAASASASADRDARASVPATFHLDALQQFSSGVTIGEYSRA